MFLIAGNPNSSMAVNPLDEFANIKRAGMLVLDENQQAQMAVNPDNAFIPASTVKLISAWLALNHWGEEYRFRSHFYLDQQRGVLWIKGSGDPYLVSEEIQMIAENLAKQGLKKLNAIGVDGSLFETGLVLPGTSKTDNPYDAVPSAIAANFNSINFKKRDNQVLSAEPQTPITPYSIQHARKLKKKSGRVNTGGNPQDAERYFAEILTAMLRQQGIQVEGRIISGVAPKLPIFYTHINSRNLAEMVRGMMKYSTNFLANQLILALSAEVYRRPANAADLKRYMETTLKKQFNWRDFNLNDAAGLSRENRISPSQLVTLLKAFKKWKHLLPEVESSVYAKSGTLNGVSTLAGYIVNGQRWEPFAVMMNQVVSYRFRNRLAEAISLRKNGRVIN